MVVDVVDKLTRSRMMAGIGGKNTKPELVLRRALHARGFRYRLHVKEVSGHPDLVLPKYRAVIFVHGCFWHRHTGCRYATEPATRAKFWQSKFQTNVERDARVRKELLEGGWRVAIVWECALRKRQQVAPVAESIAVWLPSHASVLELGETDATTG